MADYKRYQDLVADYKAGKVSDAEFERQKRLLTNPFAGTVDTVAAKLDKDKAEKELFDQRVVPSNGLGTTTKSVPKAPFAMAPKFQPAEKPKLVDVLKDKPKEAPVFKDMPESAPPAPEASPVVAPESRTSTRTSSSSSMVDKAEMDAILAKARKYADNEDADPQGAASYQQALDDIEAKYETRKGNVAKSELIAQLGHALGLFIAGGGIGKLGKKVGVDLGSAEGAGDYTIEMLRKPQADFSKQYDRVADEAARAEKGAAGVHQAKQASWKDRMQAALEAASAARKTVSSGSGDSSGTGNDELARQRVLTSINGNIDKITKENSTLAGLIAAPAKKGESSDLTKQREDAFTRAGFTEEEKKFFRDNQGTGGLEFIDSPKRDALLKKANASLEADLQRRLQPHVQRYNKVAAEGGMEPLDAPNVQTKAPAGMIRVRDKASGKTGKVDAATYNANPEAFERL